MKFTPIKKAPRKNNKVIELVENFAACPVACARIDLKPNEYSSTASAQWSVSQAVKRCGYNYRVYTKNKCLYISKEV